MTADHSAKPKLVRRLEAQRESIRRRPRVVRWLIAASGFTVLLAGILMLALPGPAFVVIPIGLALLSLQFTWAERALNRSLEQASRAQRRAAATSRLQKRMAALATAFGVGALAVWAVLGDVPLLPF